MATATKPVQVVTDKQLTTTRKEVESIVHPVLSAAKAIIITDAASYTAADAFLERIREARKKVAARMDPIIEPIRKGLDALYALRREMDGPLDQAEKALKGNMKQYQLAEQRREAEEREQKRLEQERLDREKREAEEAAANARTKKQREKAMEQARILDAQSQAVAAIEVEAPVKAEASTVRKVKAWRVTSKIALIKGIATGRIPLYAVEINKPYINKYLRANADELAAWPGVEVYDDINIAGR